MKHIFRIWPRLSDLSNDLVKPYQTVAAWKNRGNIPAKYDLELVKAARARGYPLTLEELAKARAGAAPTTSDAA